MVPVAGLTAGLSNPDFPPAFSFSEVELTVLAAVAVTKEATISPKVSINLTDFMVVVIYFYLGMYFIQNNIHAKKNQLRFLKKTNFIKKSG
jgi:hypothetical protein